jgi:hypothetical protein
LAHHGEQGLCLVAFEVTPHGDIGHQTHGLVQLAQALLVDDVATHQVLAQHARGPDAKLRSAPRADAVADGDDGVEVVEPQPPTHLALALGLNHRGILGRCGFVQLSFAVDVAQMQADRVAVLVEQE